MDKLSKIPQDLTSLVNGKTEKVFEPACPHDRRGYCSKLQMMPKAHCSEDYMNACGETKKFYDKYKEAGNSLGVGS